MAVVETRRAAEILGPDGPFVSAFDRFEQRPGQQEMAASVAEAFAHGGVALIEAGTGTGKSLAYLVPAALFAIERSERVVISTRTINLQEQLLHKDIPMVQQALLPHLRARLVKGWSNYLCLMRLQAVVQEEELDPSAGEELAQLCRWADETTEGCLSELGPKSVLSPEVCAESDNCLRSDCPFFSRCFLFRARAELDEAHLLVVNHHLLFADVAVRRVIGWNTDRSVLPPYRYVVVDEAHHIEEVATDFLSDSLSEYALSRFLGRLYRPGQRSSRGVLSQIVGYAGQWLLEKRQPARAERILSLIEHTIYPSMGATAAASRSCFEAARHWVGDQGTRRIRDVAAWQSLVGANLSVLEEALNGLASRLEQLSSEVEPIVADEPAVRMELEVLVQRGQAFANMAQKLALAEDEDEVFWVEQGRRGQVRLVATSLDVAPAIEEWVGKLKTTICTSATLTIGQDFGYMRSRLGLTAIDCRELVIPSPFHYKEQVLVSVPKGVPDPNDPRYAQALASAVTQIVKASQGRALVLFTSYSMLRHVARALQPTAKQEGWPLLVQGEQSRSYILNAFRSNASVLLGTDSFWEGVDVPGEALSCLILTRLPFRAPDNPVVEARLELLRRRGYDPFYSYSLPDAVLKFKQGFGRLIRTRHDRGVVVICDQRVLTRGYGRQFLASLPECTSHQGSIEEVVRAIREWL